MLRKWTSYLTEKLDTRFKRIGLLAFGPSFLTLLILAIAWNVQTLSRGVIYYKEFPFIYPNIIYHPRYDQKPLADGEDQYVIGPKNGVGCLPGNDCTRGLREVTTGSGGLSVKPAWIQKIFFIKKWQTGSSPRFCSIADLWRPFQWILNSEI